MLDIRFLVDRFFSSVLWICDPTAFWPPLFLIGSQLCMAVSDSSCEWAGVRGFGTQYSWQSCWGEPPLYEWKLGRRKEPQISDVLTWNRAAATELEGMITSCAEAVALDWELGKEGSTVFLSTPAQDRSTVMLTWEGVWKGGKFWFKCYRLAVLTKI